MFFEAAIHSEVSVSRLLLLRLGLRLCHLRHQVRLGNSLHIVVLLGLIVIEGLGPLHHQTFVHKLDGRRGEHSGRDSRHSLG